MARCPDCNKFVSYEQAEPELELEANIDKEEDGTPGDAIITGTVHLVLNCGDCGTEMAEADSDVEVNVALDHKPDMPDHEAEISGEGADAVDRYDGKPDTPWRYRRHFYGANISGTVKCSCGAESEFSTEVEKQAGSFESLV